MGKVKSPFMLLRLLLVGVIVASVIATMYLYGKKNTVAEPGVNSFSQASQQKTTPDQNANRLFPGTPSHQSSPHSGALSNSDFATLDQAALQSLRQSENTVSQTAENLLSNKPEEEKHHNPAVLPELPPEMVAEIKRLSDTSSDGLYEEYQADGSVHMDLQGRFQSVPIAVIDSNGAMHTYMHGDAYKPGPVSEQESDHH